MVRYFNGKGKYLREGNRRYEEKRKRKGGSLKVREGCFKKEDLEGKVG